MIFDLVKVNFIDTGGELDIRYHSMVESEWNGISNIGKDGIWAVLYRFDVSGSGESF